MSYETGDIIIYNRAPGHVAMVYDRTKVVHATGDQNFHLTPMENEVNGINSYMMEDGKVYRPPWGKHSEIDKDQKQIDLRRIAIRIMQTAKYSKYRAARLFAGSSLFGTGAQKRLDKYMLRDVKDPETGDRSDKFVSTVTCSEAVILCYQTVFYGEQPPFFIRLDAAHTMPKTLGSWLQKNWGEPEKV